MALPPPTCPPPSLLFLNLQGIKSAVKPNWKRNGFVQWEAASINPNLNVAAERLKQKQVNWLL